MSDEPAFDPDPILAALNAHGVDYVVVGGLAVAAHGVIRATADLDLVVAAEWDNAEALSRALLAVDARDLDDRSGAITRESLVRRVDRRLCTRHGDVHLLHQVDGVPRYEQLVPAAVFDLGGGVTVPVARLEDLKAMKRAGGRAKDGVDLAELEALGSGVAIEIRPPDYLFANPDRLSGLGPDAVEEMFGGAPGWRVETLRRGSRRGAGWVLREYDADGNLTGRLIRWHPGDGHHGPEPYWRVSSSRYGRSEEIR